MSYTGYQKPEFCLKQGRKISDICLQQGQGMRGRAAFNKKQLTLIHFIESKEKSRR